VEFQFLAEEVFLSDQQHLHVIVTGGKYRTIDFRFGRLVGAHCINGNRGWHACLLLPNLVRHPFTAG